MITPTKPYTAVDIEPQEKLSVPRETKQLNHWVFNWRLAVITVVLAAVALPLVYLWHAFQVDRNASSLVVLADRCEQRDEWMEAAEHLHRYLQLRPADVDATLRMADDFWKGAKQPLQKARGVQLYSRALSLAPERDDLQRRLMVVRLEAGDHRAALKDAQTLLSKTPDDADALRVSALAQHRQWRLRRSVTDKALLAAYRAAIEKNPGDDELASGLATFYRSEMPSTKKQTRADLEKLADGVMDRMVANSDTPQANIARYLYRQQYHLPDAETDLDQAMAADLKKQSFIVWWLAGLQSQSAGDAEAAVQHFQDAVAIDPLDRRGHLGLGNAYVSQGQDELAIQAWQAGLTKASPADVELELLIAAAHIRQEQWPRTETALKKLEKQIAPLTGPQPAEWLSMICLLRGDLAMGQKQFAAALAPLKQSLTLKQAGAASLTRSTSIAQVEMRLARCYGAIGEWDQAALAYQRAAELQPREAGPRMLAAAAWEAAGRYDEAARQYGDVPALVDNAGGALVAAANAEYLWQLSRIGSQRDWRSLATLLAKASEELKKQGTPQPPLGTLLECEYDAEHGNVDQAVERAKGIESALVENTDLVRRLLFDYERWKRPADADRLLEQWRLVNKEPADYVLLASDLQVRRGRRTNAYGLLTEALAGASDAALSAIQFRLASLYVADGKPEQAKPIMAHLAEANQNDLRSLQFLAEFALQTGEAEDAASYIKQLETREGPDGTNWRYYRAQQIMSQAGREKDATAAAKLYQQAAELQQQLETLRPAWAPGFLLKARLAELGPGTRGAASKAANAHIKQTTAIDAYVQAIKLGARSVPIYDTLISLLYRENRLSEADAYLRELREIGPLPDEISPVAMAIDLRQGNPARALELAREKVAAEPDDAMRHLRLGTLLARDAGEGESADPAKLTEAEMELKRAQELSPADSRTWAALLSFYVGRKQTDEAAALLDKVRESNVMGAEETPFFLAQGYASLGDEEQATTFYTKAVEAAPDRQAVQVQSGAYFFKRDPQLAEKCLRRALEIEPDHRTAAELLAVLLASRGGADKEIDRLLSEGPIETKDQRLHAMLLLRRGGRHDRQRAQELLETLVGDARQAAPVDRLLLARMYESQAALAKARGDLKAAEKSMADARDQLKLLVNGSNPAPEHLAAYIDCLLRSDKTADVASRLDELAQLEPETSSLRTLSLRLRWLKADKQPAAVETFIDSYVASRMESLVEKPAQSRTLQVAAELYSKYDLLELAEQSLRRAAEIDATANAALVNWLNAHDRTSEAVQVCLDLAETDHTTLPAMMLANVLAVGKPTDEDSQAAAPVIERAMRENADHPGLLFTMSIKCLMAGDNAESVRLLREVLKLQPRNVAAMNNLAFLLSLKPADRDEAATWMAKAIELAGGNAELVDSKGWVLLQQGKLTEAIDAFQEALNGAPADARYHFHLALAFQLQGKVKEARDAMQIARRNGLASIAMPPDERSAVTSLETALQ